MTRAVVAASVLALVVPGAAAQKAGGDKAGGDKAAKPAGQPAAKPAPEAKPARPMAAGEARRLLAEANVDAAVAAAVALGASKSAEAQGILLDALAVGLAPPVAEAALAGLSHGGGAKAFDTAAVYANHRNPKVRAAAVRLAGAIDDRRADALVLDGLHDGHTSVRAIAAEIVAKKRLKAGIEPLLALLKRGDEATAPALAQLADATLAKDVAELIGQAPDNLVARCLGGVLLRPEFKPESARVEVVRALGKVPGQEALEQLTTYVASVPENPPRQSRREAEALVESRLGGGQ